MTTRLGSRVLRTLVAALVCVLAGGEARAAPSAAPGFDQPLASSVFGTALRFMAPRILDPVSLRTLAGWGLGGITALDPSLQASVVGDRLVLSSAAGPVWRGPSPQDDDPAAWGEALAAITAAAWRVSSAVSGAGQVGVTQSFFDELFNHLDPYSRYVGPEPADADRDKREGSGGGIGVTLLRTSRGLALGDIAPDGPAADAGLATGARLLAIDGVDVGRADPDDALARLAGPVGSAVTIRIRLHGRTRDLTLQRDLVPPETVFGTSTDGLLTLKVTGFSRDTAEEMSALLERGAAGPPARPDHRPPRQSRRPAAAGRHRRRPRARQRRRHHHRRPLPAVEPRLERPGRRRHARHADRGPGRRPHRERRRDPGRGAGRPPTRGGHRLGHARQGPGADAAAAARRRRTVRHLEPGPGPARLAAAGVGRAAAALHLGRRRRRRRRAPRARGPAPRRHSPPHWRPSAPRARRCRSRASSTSEARARPRSAPTRTSTPHTSCSATRPPTRPPSTRSRRLD